jgi:hypothetical protein
MIQVFRSVSPWLWLLLWVVGGTAAAQSDPAADAAQEPATEAAADQAVDEAVAEATGFPPEQIEQLLAPVALYPDALLAQLLMASTYPLDIVQASRWVEDHADLEGEALQDAVVEQRWDPSVQALAFFPSVLQYMNANLDWTQDLGEAFLGQQDEVMEAVQTLRREAHEAGNLEENEHQQVLVEGDTIVVQPAQPEVVYVPSYDPSQVYNQPPPQQTYYPSTYAAPSTSSGSSDLVTFGVGALVGGLLTAAIMWDRDDHRHYGGVYYGGRGSYGRPGYWSGSGYRSGGYRKTNYINRNVNIQTGDINVNKGIGGNAGKWEHNSARRGNIRYKNEKAKARYAGDRGRTPVNREVARGRQPEARRAAAAAPGARSQGKRTPTKRTAASPPKKRDVNLKRPATRQPAKPQQRAAQAPKRKSPTASAPKRKPASKPARHKPSGGAFNKSHGNLDRAASQRGSKSIKRSGRSGGGGRSRRG